ncbi:hypothetical protein LCGC14_0267550 [marine sediment metagenome]|uniref:Uncharacterized protein n=1 Tax=marine sediment metagenome TaxID=412755 RepID=A0A0F9U4P4_9ZZZZ
MVDEQKPKTKAQIKAEKEAAKNKPESQPETQAAITSTDAMSSLDLSSEEQIQKHIASHEEMDDMVTYLSNTVTQRVNRSRKRAQVGYSVQQINKSRILKLAVIVNEINGYSNPSFLKNSYFDFFTLPLAKREEVAAIRAITTLADRAEAVLDFKNLRTISRTKQKFDRNLAEIKKYYRVAETCRALFTGSNALIKIAFEEKLLLPDESALGNPDGYFFNPNVSELIDSWKGQAAGLREEVGGEPNEDDIKHTINVFAALYELQQKYFDSISEVFGFLQRASPIVNKYMLSSYEQIKTAALKVGLLKATN